MSSPSPIPEALLALAPTRLANHRTTRYQGDGLCVDLSRFAERDRTLLIRLYQILTELLYAVADASATDTQRWEAVVAWARHYDLDALIDEVRELGSASNEERPDEQMAKTLHDVRGGAFSSLLGRLQMLDYLPHEEKQLQAIFVQTRDHLKIMRNAIAGLDEPRRNADRQPKAHAMRLMLDKWQNATVGPNWHTQPVRMEIDCRYTGPLTECCMESAAIDRIFYNLAANATRYAADDRLEMVIFPVPETPGDCLRFVLSNQVSEANADTLRARARGADPAEDMPALFEPTVSSTGSGFGLTVVADFVAGAFALPDRATALRERYVGAILDGRTFRVWFHWPLAHDSLPPKLDDYHRPQESLSEV